MGINNTEVTCSEMGDTLAMDCSIENNNEDDNLSTGIPEGATNEEVKTFTNKIKEVFLEVFSSRV